MKAKERGKLGEDYSENFLASQNYQIIKRNYYSRFGEIDIIAIDRNVTPNQLVLFEVKTRSGNVFGEPQESIDRKKIQRILKTTSCFLASLEKAIKLCWRIDIIALKLSSQHRVVKINHFKNILDGY